MSAVTALTDRLHLTAHQPPAPVARLADVALDAPDGSTPPWPGREVALTAGGGRRLFVRHTPPTAKDALPALFVHGLGGASTNWTDYSTLLRDRLSIEALDLFGFGRSDAAPGNRYTIDAHAKWVEAYLDQSRRGPVHLVGNSMGGAIVIRLAARRPDLVRTLTLISPAVPDLRPQRALANPRLILGAVPYVGPSALRRAAAIPAEKRVKALMRMVYGDPSRVSAKRLAEAAEEMREADTRRYGADALVRSLRGLITAYLAIGPRSLWADLARVRVPTLVVWGDRDQLVNADLAPRTAATARDGRLLMLPGVGHVAQLEDPVSTARATIALLQDAAG